MGAVTLENAVRSLACDAIGNSLDAGSAAGYVEIRTSGGTTLLVSIDLNDPAFGAAVNGVKTLDVSPALSGTAVATGTAAVCRFYDSDDTLRFSGSVTLTSGGGLIEIETTAIEENDVITITGGTLTVPAT